MFRTFRFNMKVARLARVLGAPFDLQQYRTRALDPKAEALEELLDICIDEPALSSIIFDAGTTRDEMRSIYHTLIANGAGQWIGRHYVAVSAISFPHPLTLVLANVEAGLDWRHLVVLLIEYLEAGGRGPVPLTLRGGTGIT